MPSGGSRRGHRPKREANLGGLLANSEKNELVLLATSITDKMQQKIIEAFDSSGLNKPSKQSSPNFWNKLPANLKDLSLRSRSRGSQGPALTVQDENAPQSAVGPREEPQGDKNEVIGLQELKKESLQSFRRWQTSVHRRIGDISVKSPSSNKKSQPSSGGKRPPRGLGRGKGSCSSARAGFGFYEEMEVLTVIQMYIPGPQRPMLRSSNCIRPLRLRCVRCQ